jgi:hypothetical protein
MRLNLMQPCMILSQHRFSPPILNMNRRLLKPSGFDTSGNTLASSKIHFNYLMLYARSQPDYVKMDCKLVLHFSQCSKLKGKKVEVDT